MPVLLALLSIWYINFFHTSAQAIVPYAYRLRYLIPYLQQAIMESNGKSVDLDGNAIEYNTSPIIFGEEGCNGQHTYHQLLHQGKHLIPVDFILVGKTENENDHHQQILMASGLSQAQALLLGKKDIPHRAIPGNRPSNLIYLPSITPKTLGSLVALYEHKIFVESVIWGINPFDQWGVELGKQLLPHILASLRKEKTDTPVETLAFIEYMRSIQEAE
jgi:glucose-6-phosphate isomerase